MEYERYIATEDAMPVHRKEQNEGVSSFEILVLLGRIDNGYTPTEQEVILLSERTILDWSYRSGLKVLPKSISMMYNLLQLNLNSSGIETLENIETLTKLAVLMIKNTLVSDLSPLGSLTGLYRLDLDYTNIRDIEPLRNHKVLRRLYLCGTRIADLSPLKNAVDLERLYIDGTNVTIIPDWIGNCKNLKRLILDGLKLRAIPKTLLDLGLPFVWRATSEPGLIYLGKDIISISDISLSAQPTSIFQAGNKIIHAYFDAPKIPVRESKVIFLGDGGAGKTHTIKRILNQGSDEGIGTDATLGISINRYPAEGKSGSFDINFWDFGGQENMHAMHRCFLTERTLYVVVINNRWDLDQQARYWLDNVRSFAPDSPVILAVNLWEGIHKFGLDTNRLHRDYTNLVEIQPYAAKGEDHGNFQALTNLIVEQAEKLDSCAMELPVNWADIRQEMIDKANSDEWYLNRETYHEICAKHGLGEDQSGIRSWLLEWLNDLGVCFSYHRDRQTREELGTYKVLNPKWLTSAIYILLNTAKKNYRNGVMTLGMIETLLESPNPKKLARKDECDYILPDVEYSPEECQYILQVMRKFGLSYPIDEDAEFIPALCDSQMPKDLHPTGWGTPISYEFRYSFLPDSVIQRMMIRLYGSKTFTKLWRKGFRFDEPDHGLITVVDAGGPNDVLRIDVYSNKENKGRDVMMGLITNIAAVNAELNLKPEQYIIVHGNRGEIPAPTDMILQAKEQKFTTLPLYSKENGLVEKNVDEILGYTYGETIIEAAQQITKGDRRRLSETVPQIINNYYVYGNIYNSNTPDSLLELLERMAEQNVQVSNAFIEYLLEQLRDSGDENAKKLAEDLKKDKGDGFLKKLGNGIKALPKLATGAKTAVTDGMAAYDAAKPVIAAVKAALLTHGPQIAEGAMELLNLLPPG